MTNAEAVAAAKSGGGPNPGVTLSLPVHGDDADHVTRAVGFRVASSISKEDEPLGLAMPMRIY